MGIETGYTEDMNEYIAVTATITDKWGRVETVDAGTQPAWAWQIDRCARWRKMMRKQLLADRTSTPTGWRVTFSGQALEA